MPLAPFLPHPPPPSLQRLEELKQEDAERRKREAKYLELGKKAYEFGEYPTSVEYLERAVEDCGRETSYGGEALMWLALAYQVGAGCQLPAAWLCWKVWPRARAWGTAVSRPPCCGGRCSWLHAMTGGARAAGWGGVGVTSCP